MSPRQHPTGLAALAAAGVVLLARRFRVELTADEAAVLVGLCAAVVSKFTPRNPSGGA